MKQIKLKDKEMMTVNDFLLSYENGGLKIILHDIKHNSLVIVPHTDNSITLLKSDDLKTHS